MPKHIPSRGFIIVSFYTIGTPYETEAERLIESCERFMVAHQIRGVPNLGSWQKNTQHKACFMRDVREELAGPIVWLDADAELCQYPTALAALEGSADVAVHYRHGVELLSGTVWLADTDVARKLLDQWVRFCKSHPETWDQQALDMAIGATHGVRVHRLPAPYCLIFDTMKDLGPPVVLHHQASRRLKKAVGA